MKKLLHFSSILLALLFAGIKGFAQPVINYPGTSMANAYVLPVGTAITTQIPTNTGTPVGTFANFTNWAAVQEGSPNSGGIFYDATIAALYGTEYVYGQLDKITLAAAVSDLNGGLPGNTGYCVVTDATGTLYYNYGTAVWAFATGTYGTYTTRITGFTAVKGIAVDASNNFYVVDAGTGGNAAGTLYKFAKGANGAKTVATSTLTGLNNPSGIAISGNNIFLAEYGTTIGLQGIFEIAGGVTTLATPTSFVAETTLSSVPFKAPRNLTFDASGNLYVADYSNAKIERITSAGTLTYLTALTNVTTPNQITFDPTGNMYCGDLSGYYKKAVGTYFSYTGTLPPGLAFNTYTGAITGTPTTIGAYSIVVTAASTSGNNSPLTTVTFNCGAPVLSYAGTPYSFTTGVTNTTATITNTGGAVTGAYTFTATSGTLPAGITFNTTNGTFTCVPTAAGTVTGTVTASNAGGTGSAPITITVTNPAAPNLSYAGSPYTFAANVSNTTVPITDGGGPVVGNYTFTILTGALPAGITFSNTSGTFTVIPTAAGFFTGTVAGGNAGGTSTANISITVTGTPPPTVSYSPTNSTFTTGLAITPLTPTVTNSPTGYVLVGTLPTGLSFSTTTGVISGTATATQASTPYTVIASNAGGPGTSNTFYITVVNPPVFSYASPQTYTVGTAIPTLSPTITSGGPLSSATISPALPAGLSMSASGVITGNPTAVSAAATYTITALGSAGGTGTSTVSIVVYPASPTIAYTGSPYTYTVGTAITTLTPAVTGAPTSYSISPALPAGLAFSTTNGQISGNPTATAVTATYTISAINANPVAGTTMITITVNPKAPVINYSTPNSYVVGQNVTLTPTNTGGAATWAVTSGTLPSYFTLNTSTGVISGMPTSVLPTTSYTVTATNVSGSSNKTIVITVNQAPVIAYSPNSYSFTVGTAIPTTITPVNSGGPVAGPGAFGAGTNLANVDFPAELAIDRLGNLYSADYGYDRIRKYTGATGTPANFGPAFNFVIGVATDASNNVYALDNGTGLVTKYNSAGTAQTFTSPTFSDGVWIATDPNGNVYVADDNADAVYGMTPTGTVFETITTNINNPSAIATDPSGNLYVLNNNFAGASTITKYNTSGGYLSTITLPASYTPVSLAIDGAGNAYIGDSDNGSVYEYNSSNALVTTINAGGFTDPDGLAVDAKGNVFVADDENETITEYSPLTAYSVNGPLPAGITFNTTTGQFSGTPTQGFASTIYTVTAYNSTGSGSTQITFVCPTTTPSITYTTPDVYTVGTAISSLSPGNTGGPVTVYSISPNLPAGLLFNPNTGVISGTPTAASVATNYTVTATNSAGSTTAIVNITVVPAAPIIAYNPSSYSFAAGTGGSTAGPTNTGGPVVTYSFDSSTPPPSYMMINPTTGVITVSSACVVTAAVTYTIDATNANPTVGKTSITITIAVPPILTYSPANPYTVGNPLSLAPMNSGSAVGTTGLTYSSIAYATTGLNKPWGETFDAAGNLYVTDDGTTNTINEYNSGGGYIGNFITNTGAITVTAPTGIVFYGGNAYISTQAGYVYEFNSSGVYVATIVTGGNGSATKPKSIYGLAVDGSGNLYMTDYREGYIYKYTAGGTTAIIAQVGTTTGLDDPTGITVSGGNVYFVDAFYNNLVELSSGGTYITTLSLALSTPYGLSADANGNFYVSNTGTAAIDIFSSTGTLTNNFTPTGTNPRGVVADASGNIYVSDYTANTVTKYYLSSGYKLVSGTLPAGINFSTVTGTFSGTPTAAFGPSSFTVTGYNGVGSSTTTFSLQCSLVAPNITYTPNTENYPVNRAIASLAPANSGGGIIANNTGFGAGTVFATIAAANAPWGMAIDSYGDIFVADYGAKAIIEYNSTGSTILSLSTSTYNPTGVAVDASGNIYAIMSNGIVYKWNSSGTGGIFFTNIESNDGNVATSGYGIAVDASGNLYISDDDIGYVWKYTVSANTIVKFVASAKPSGIVTDAAGNFYFVDLSTKTLKEYTSAGTLVSTIISGLNTPYGLYRDAVGHFFIGGSTAAGSVTEYSSTGTVITTLTSQTSPRGMVTDNQGNLYVSDYTAGNITKYPANLYSINTASVGALPAGITFNAQTGTFSGTPTANFGPVTFTITCNGYGGTTSSTNVTITCYTSYDWIGAVSTDWNTTGNWESLTVPTSANTAMIGVNLAFTNQPNVGSPGANAVGAVQIGNTGGKAVTLTVTSPYILAVTGDITKQSDANSTLGYSATLNGTGAITATNLNIIASTATASAYTETLTSTINTLTLSGAVKLTSNMGTVAENAQFLLTGGTTSVAGALTTTNQAGSNSTFNISSGTLQVLNTTFLSGLSATGTNAFTLGTTSTIQYAGAGQTVYTDAAIANLPAGLSYYGLAFSGTGIMTPTAGNLNVAANFTNTMANDAGDYLSLTSTPAFFNSTGPQSLAGGGGNGTVFSTVNFKAGGAATMTSGLFCVSSTGILTMANSSSLIAGGFLTLNSDATGSASVAQIPAGCNITGTVNVQRYISGERGYRLLSSPVYAGSQAGNNIYSINYLISNPVANNNLYLTGPNFAATAYTAAGNPTVFLYDEGFVPQYTTFYNSNFIAISSLSSGTGTDPTYAMYSPNGATTPVVSGGYNIPVGNGYYCFFRGNYSEGVATLTNPNNTTIVPATVVASGTLNIGQIAFADWYTPASRNLGGVSQNFNLIGNPYASAIDLGTIQGTVSTSGIYITPYDGTNGISKFIYELNPNSGSYGIYTYDGSVAPTNSAGEYIASGQGFMVLAYGTTSQLTFNESAKAATANADAKGEMAKRVAGFNPVQANPLMVLKMSADSIHTEETVLSFNQNASSKYVFNEDAPHKAGVGVVGISTMSSDNLKMAINTMPVLSNMTIPMNVNATVSGLYNIALNQIRPLPAIYEVWLKDAYRKDSLDIKDNPTYNFDINTSDTTTYGSSRFSLVIRENPALMVHLLSFNATKAIAGVNVLWTTENEQNYTNFTVERSTDGGKTFANLGGFASSAVGAYTYLDKNPVVGANMYRLEIVDLTGAVSYSSVVTIMYANSATIALNGQMLVYPNPTAGMVNLSIQQVTSSNAATATASYKIEIVNNLGIVVRNAVSATPTWSSDVTSLLPGTYFINVVNASNNAIVGKSAFVKL